MSDVQRTVEELAGRLDYPMFIVTTVAGERQAGCLVGFCTQCSVDPARFAVFISNKNFTHAVALEASALAVHVVPREREDLARLFGEETGHSTDKFAHCGWEPGPLGVPLLRSCRDRFVARIVDRVETGDHMGFIVEPVAAEAQGETFLPFSVADRFEPGHPA